MMALLAVFLLLTCNSVGVLSESHNENVFLTSAKDEYIEEYIVKILPRYLRAIGVTETDTVCVSNPYKILWSSDDDVKLYLVTNGERCYGELLISVTTDGSYTSSFYETNDSRLDKWIADARTMTFFAADDVLVIESRGELLSQGTNALAIADSTIDLLQQEERAFSYLNVALLPQNSITSAGYQYYLTVPIAANANIGDGLCWAACCAMVGNYRNATTSYTALNIYYALQSIYGGTPMGSTTWYSRAYNYCGLPFHSTSILTSFELYNLLSTGIPAILEIYPYWYSSLGHAVVLRGVEIDDPVQTYSPLQIPIIQLGTFM